MCQYVFDLGLFLPKFLIDTELELGAWADNVVCELITENRSKGLGE